MNYQWAEREDFCDSKVSMADDHWGAIRLVCDLVAGHPGCHATRMEACTPIAVLTWETS